MTTTDMGSSPSPSSVVPALTILAHPDVERIGERSVLPLLALGREARLARLEPVFEPTDGVEPTDGATRKRALDERSISRRPILLRGIRGDAPGDERLAIRLDARETRTRLLVDDQPIEDEHFLDADALDRGCILQIGRHVVLLLHRVARPAPEEAQRFGLVGESDSVIRLCQELERLAPLDVPVLLRGESGTGKELAARALHEGGPRRSGPFVAVNMATLSPALASAELFGAERGAYTGADRKKKGFFAGANGGTLFLDEIGETPIEVQAMLLRTLENREVLPIGSIQAQPVDVRVIAATDARLEQAMADGSFRAPLFHRLAGYAVFLPPLRQRRDDLGRLLRFFLAAELRTLGTVPKDRTVPEDRTVPFPPAKLVARLARYDWPGNVRELRNVARRLAIIGPESDPARLLESIEGLAVPEEAQESTQKKAPPAIPSETGESKSTHRRASDFSDEEIFEALRVHRWDVLNTAKDLSVSRSALNRRMEKSGIGRKVADLDLAEIEEATQRSSGNIEEMVEILQVSKRALRRRLTRLKR